MVQMKKKLEQLFLSKRKIWHVNLKKKKKTYSNYVLFMVSYNS